MDAERTTITDEERALRVWNYLRDTHAPIPVKLAFQKLALALLDDVNRHNLKFWEPQVADDEWEER